MKDGGEKKTIFKYLFFIISRKVKAQLKCQKKKKQKKNKIYVVFGEGALTDPMCQKWFVKFYAGDFSLEDAPQSGRPLKLLTIKWRHPLKSINIIQHGNSRHTQNIQIEHEDHLYQFGYVNCFDVWVPHKLSGKQSLAVFPPATLYLNMMKMFSFTNI